MGYLYEIQRYFEYGHLPPHLQEVSKPFFEMADAMAQRVQDCEETEAGLRKLLEAKDCAVRAAVKQGKK